MSESEFILHVGCLLDRACLFDILFVMDRQIQCCKASHTSDITLHYHKQLLDLFCYTHICLYMYVYKPNELTN